MRPLRHALLLAVAAALLAPAGATAAVTAAARATPAAGPAPLSVTFDASRSRSDQPGGITSATWAFGDGTSAVGLTIGHTYVTPGIYTATVTVADATGATAQAAVVVRATAAGALTLAVPPSATAFGEGAHLKGALQPALAGQKIRVEGKRSGRWVTLGVATTHAGGAWHLALRARTPIDLRARWTGASGFVRGAVSPTQSLQVRPTLHLAPPLATVYGSVSVNGSIAPARPRGHVVVTVRHGSKVVFRRAAALTGGRRFAVTGPAGGSGTYAVDVAYQADGTYAATALSDRVEAVYPSLGYGDSGPAVATLRSRLAALGYRQATGGSTFGADLVDAVLAFQKVQGLERTGTATPALWLALARPKTLAPRYPAQGDHIEVDKGHQVLLVVRGGRVATILPVSTGGFGRYTPEGTFSIQRKVTGFDPSPLGTLYDPMYFTGGYAIHGNPSVPPYPASHGCIRIPMWAAPWMFDTNGIGEPVDVYS
jgi:lipoprotein-anchoring transpeptidase ErfK/SrfK